MRSFQPFCWQRPTAILRKSNRYSSPARLLIKPDRTARQHSCLLHAMANLKWRGVFLMREQIQAFKRRREVPRPHLPNDSTIPSYITFFRVETRSASDFKRAAMTPTPRSSGRPSGAAWLCVGRHKRRVRASRHSQPSASATSRMTTEQRRTNTSSTSISVEPSDTSPSLKKCSSGSFTLNGKVLAFPTKAS